MILNIPWVMKPFQRIKTCNFPRTIPQETTLWISELMVTGWKLRGFHLMECPGDCCKATIQSCCHIYQAQALIVAARKTRESHLPGNNLHPIVNLLDF